MWRNAWKFRLALQLKIVESRPLITRHVLREHFANLCQSLEDEVSSTQLWRAIIIWKWGWGTYQRQGTRSSLRPVSGLLYDEQCSMPDTWTSFERSDKPRGGAIRQTAKWNLLYCRCAFLKLGHSWWWASEALRDEFVKKAEAYCANERRNMKSSEALLGLKADMDW